ncbi:Leucine rich repeat containing protein 5 [Sarcoptes scabiei]|uniref:Leucine rich repeat containing protein 5 n=1 Tax=Sarcoptes scabiei TaxID=52283 RepID=A0A131ZVN1_SARSC|nr:Leucine rich repeat containing protein 5 [Sarcoptes scabiei]
MANNICFTSNRFDLSVHFQTQRIFLSKLFYCSCSILIIVSIVKPIHSTIAIEQSSVDKTLVKSELSSQSESASNDEEALPSEDSSIAQLIDRRLFSFPEQWSNSSWLQASPNHNNGSESIDFETVYNCSYVQDDVFCDCDLHARKLICYNIQTVDDIRQAFDHVLARTRRIYWNRLEIHCIEPFVKDDEQSSSQEQSSSKSTSTVPPNNSFHISSVIFTEGPRFESVVFVGDCSKPRHYDNLIAVDRDVQQIVIHRNMLRISTSCSLLQPKFERLQELILKDCLVAGDMISSTFSTRCLGQYGTRNEPMQLSRLTISGCNISLIEGGAFYNFAELELIDLSRNQISRLSRQAFAPHLYRLRTLKLDHNRLTHLNGEFFEKLPELREIILSDNRLQTLPFLPSAGPGLAQVLHLQNNLWDCRCRLIWLLEEPLDSIRLISDEPRCSTPENFFNQTLLMGLRI